MAELGPLPNARTPAAPDRLAALLAETPADPGWAAELQELRDADEAAAAAAARDPWAA